MSHALLSPSKSPIWMACPGSAAMQLGRPNGSNAFADEGTAAHHLYYLCLTGNKMAKEYLGATLLVGTLDDEQQTVFDTAAPEGFVTRHTQKVDNTMVLLLSNALSQTWGLLAGAQAIYCEDELPVGLVTGEAGAIGTADVVSIFQRRIDIHDLKFGMREVLPTSTQLVIYALAAIEKYDPAYGPFDSARLYIHQPKTNDTPKSVEYSIAELQALRKEIEDKAWSALSALNYRDNWLRDGKVMEPSYLASGEHCRYCLASGDCARQDTDAQAAALVGFHDLTAAASSPPVPTPAELDILNPADLSAKLAACDFLELYAAAVRDFAFSKAMSGEKVPGYKLVLGRRGNRAWTDEGEAEKSLKSMGLKVDDMYNKTVISPTAAEKIFGPKGDKPSTRRWNALQKLIAQSDGKPSLVPETDTRAEYLPAAPSVEGLQDLSKPVVRNEDLI